MITKVIMPQMSLTMQTGFVSKWFKSEGDSVNTGDVICAIEGDKAALEIEAPASGFLKKIIAQEGEDFPVKQIMAYIGDAGDIISDLVDANAQVEYQKTNESGTKNEKEESIPFDDRVKASPIAKRLAKEIGIDLSKIKGTGPEGLISKEDILSYQEPARSSYPEREFQELNSIEKVIAEKMALSNKEIPHFHLSTTCNANSLNKLRADANQETSNDIHITITDIIIWAVSQSLIKHPKLNASYQPNKIVLNKNINIGLAVDTPKGLIVVVIKDANKMSIKDIATARDRLARKANLGKQSPDDLSEGTFTISNLGMFGIESFDPIITPGQVGILGVGATKKLQEMDENGNLHQTENLTLTLGCDHRIVDGVTGAKFLSSLKEMLENPQVIL